MLEMMPYCSIYTRKKLVCAQELPKWCPKCSIFNQTTKFGKCPKKNAPSVWIFNQTMILDESPRSTKNILPQVLNIHPNYNIWQVPKKCQKNNAPSVEYSPKLQY
jgi:hypothetical protein